MHHHSLPALLVSLVSLTALAGVACDQPSGSTLPPITAPSAGGATITGSIVLSGGGAPPSASTGASVRAAGSNTFATVDNNQSFTLTNVPANTRDGVVLVFNGAGLNTQVNIGVVNFADHVVIVFARSGGTLVFTRSDRRVGDGTDLTGRVDSVSFTQRSFIVLGQTILTDQFTVFLHADGTPGSFFDLFVGRVVQAKSVVIPGGLGAVLAKTVRLEDTGGGAVVIVQGAIVDLQGTSRDFSFVVRGIVIRGGSATTFDANRTFAVLRNGETVEVTGIQRDGFLQATRIRMP